ncbi:hypothetical protein ACFL1G_09505 [Planctomycetota bacterium]
MEQEMLEILIGKYIDGEITSSEQQILDAEIQKDSEGRELLEQLQQLDTQSREVVNSEVLERGKTADEIFESAWRQRKKPALRLLIPSAGWARFAAGLAAGLVIGVALHSILSGRAAPQIEPGRNAVVAVDSGEQSGVRLPTVEAVPAENAQGVTHNIDWFSFTDEDGDEWLIEGLRENMVREAAYTKGL